VGNRRTKGARSLVLGTPANAVWTNADRAQNGGAKGGTDGGTDDSVAGAAFTHCSCGDGDGMRSL
ncbi:MAG: hypothetical protein ABL997_10980, partial [Planctomycetota bacterium]